MTTDQLFARTQARYERWDADCARNADIRRRVRSGQPVEQVARHYNLSDEFVGRIAGAFGV
ncbi:MAG: hypothetical protein JHC57_21675 [Sphingopyxis sp.]|uniref:hypothetical protein n=1 Tax=Sphingopyxis sp. TaxID=1908224 RepID=UPI001A2A247B|nr:hypothetical protein [Sphingopyxis sp.]MBJ7502377.1 hypothetical protein [Sphingopyxis sp.]